MKKKVSISDRPARPRNSAISNAALADFLFRLSTLCASREFGNPALAAALRELANSVRLGAIPNARDKGLSTQRQATQPARDFELLRALDSQSIELFITDETKSKNELLDLAAARFSIPRSQLKRMRVKDVRQTIRSALLHESSIEILSEEAKRDGSVRSS
jgi:hypothetical protein